MTLRGYGLMILRSYGLLGSMRLWPMGFYVVMFFFVRLSINSVARLYAVLVKISKVYIFLRWALRGRYDITLRGCGMIKGSTRLW